MADIIPPKPLPPTDPKIRLMRAKDGPFRCDHCRFFKGEGNHCPWQTAELFNGDCCDQYKPKRKGKK